MRSEERGARSLEHGIRSLVISDSWELIPFTLLAPHSPLLPFAIITLVIKAVFFDFDGLILDTESPEVTAWQELFAAHGVDFPDSLWTDMIGRNIETMQIHPLDYLDERLEHALDREAFMEEHRKLKTQYLSSEEARPGVRDRLMEAQMLGLHRAVVSSSRRGWVEEHLASLGLSSFFEILFCGREGLPGKPDPALYKAAIDHFGLKPHEALAIEDSQNGLAAAKAAGLWCVVSPNALTVRMDLSAADLQVTSLDVSLEEIIAWIEGK